MTQTKEEKATYQREWYKNHPGKAKLYRQRWLAKHPGNDIVARMKYRRNNSVKERVMLEALRHIPLKPNCEVCGSTEKLQRHHDDYSKPFEVMTLCQRCHKKRHREVKVKEGVVIGQTRYLYGQTPVKILKDGCVKGKDSRLWKIQVIESGEIKFVYGSHCHVKPDLTELIDAMNKERLRLGQISKTKVLGEQKPC